METRTEPINSPSSSPEKRAEPCKQGALLDYLDKGNDNRRACSLYLSLMDKMGVQLDRFGDSDKRLTGL